MGGGELGEVFVHAGPVPRRPAADTEETSLDDQHVVGDFNEWIPGTHELRKRTNGTRSASVVVPRGTRLRFRYLGEDGTWFNDPDVQHRDGADDVLVV